MSKQSEKDDRRFDLYLQFGGTNVTDLRRRLNKGAAALENTEHWLHGKDMEHAANCLEWLQAEKAAAHGYRERYNALKELFDRLGEE